MSMQGISLRLKEQPKLITPSFDARLNTWFLLDKARGENTLAAFYQDGGSLIESMDYLVMGTDQADLVEVSPILIKLARTELPDAVYKYVQEERSGIFLQAQDNVLEHLRYLFVMNCEAQGNVYARFYDPVFWTAMQLSLPEQQRQIWGNIQKVYSQAPDSIEELPYYLVWTSSVLETKRGVASSGKPIQLSNEFYEVSEEVRLLYFLYQAAYEENLSIPDERVARVILNLKILNKAGIERVDYLKKLLKGCIEQIDFSVKPEIQEILQADMLAYQKVAELEKRI